MAKELNRSIDVVPLVDRWGITRLVVGLGKSLSGRRMLELIVVEEIANC